MNKYPSVKKIDRALHVAMVREIFSSIPGRYDFLNRFLSARRDVAWRRFTVKHVRFFRTNCFLDVATGTADLAIEAALRYPRVRVLGLDFSEEMMDIGKEKVAGHHLSERIDFIRGDALQLPFPSESFDAAGIAFGIRNIPDKGRALMEMSRVVVPGGRVMVLEMNFPDKPLFRPLYRIYLNVILPLLARAISPNPNAYRYLADSVMHFPPPDRFKAMMTDAGLSGVKCNPLTLGIACLYVGTKPDGPEKRCGKILQ